MKYPGITIVIFLAASVMGGCQATLDKHLVREVPPGTYKVTVVEADYECSNSFGKNCVVLYDVNDDKDMRLVYSGPKKDLSDVQSDSVDIRGLMFFSITDEKGNVFGYLGFSDGQRATRATVFDNGSVVVGNAKIVRFGPLRTKNQKD